MKKETILFFQEIYRNQIAKEKILLFCKKTQLEEMNEKASFLNQLLLSQNARDLNVKYAKLKKRMNDVNEPEQIVPIQREYDQLLEQTGTYIVGTMQALQRDVFLPQDINMIHPLLSQFAHGKLSNMINKAIYWLVCQNGIDLRNILDMFETQTHHGSGEISEETAFYEQLIELIKAGNMMEWRFIQHQVYFDELGTIPQYILKDGKETLGKTIPGIPISAFDADKKNDIASFVIEGKGNITNLNPLKMDLYALFRGEEVLFSDSELLLNDNIIWDLDFSDNPINVLNHYFRERSYVVSPSAYFQFANICMLFQRVRLVFGE